MTKRNLKSMITEAESKDKTVEAGSKKLTQDELASRIGLLLKNFPNNNDLEQTHGMGLHSNTFFQKIISAEIWKKGCKIKPDDYYKGMVFVDYLATYLTDELNISSNLEELSDSAKKSLNEPYLPLEIVVLEAGLYAKEKPADYFDKKNLGEMKKRYDAHNAKVDFSSGKLKKSEPFYDAIGLMTVELVKPENHECLAKVTERSQLKALIFTDSILDYLKDKGAKKNIQNYLDQGDHFTASIAAIDNLRKEVTLSDVQDYFMKAAGRGKDDKGDEEKKISPAADMTDDILAK